MLSLLSPGETPDSTLPHLAASSPSPDYIAYIADLILELKQLSERGQLSTLTGLLSLAHSEALAELKRRA